MTPMPRRPCHAIAVVLFCVFVVQMSACSASVPSLQNRWERLEQKRRDAVAKTYPSGTPRSVVQTHHKKLLVIGIHDCDAEYVKADRFRRVLVDYMQRAYPQSYGGCDVVILARTGWTSLVGDVGLYQDYVFYDTAENVLAAYRRVID